MTDVEEISGHGVRAKVDGHDVYAGNGKWMDRIGASWRNCHRTGTVVHVAVDGEYAGHIVISERGQAVQLRPLKRSSARGSKRP